MIGTLTFYFIQTQHYVPALISGNLWTLAAVACMRDMRRRHCGWVTVTLGVVWLATTLILGWRLETL